MVGKNNNKVSFVDIALEHTEKKWETHWLKRIDSMVNWNKFSHKLEKRYAKGEGRPSYPPIQLFKCLLLAEWYGLSDRQLEEAMEFRIDFRKFTGLSFELEAPDYSTFSVFRKRMLPIWNKLLTTLNEQLEIKGFKIKKAISVDATLVEAHSKPTGKDSEGDEDASWRGFPSKKIKDEKGNEQIARRPALYGYKINLSSSVNHGFIADVSVCKASEHETHHLTEFISKETKEVYADKGYVGNRILLQKRKIKDGIQMKASRGNPLTQKDIERNKRITKKRRIVESIFGSLKTNYGWHKTRFVGLIRNQLGITLTAIAWNIRKLYLITQ